MLTTNHSAQLESAWNGLDVARVPADVGLNVRLRHRLLRFKIHPKEPGVNIYRNNVYSPPPPQIVKYK